MADFREKDRAERTLEEKVRAKYADLTGLLIEKNITITTMESCTSGQVASLLTDTEGASAIMKGAFVTYSNEAKIRQGVPAEVLLKYGVYSRETAAAMAEACRRAYGADIGVGITGSFGNVDPGNADSVPGEVYYAVCAAANKSAAADGTASAANGTQSFHIAIPPQASRLAYKLYVADIVADDLLSRIRKK